MNTVSLDVEKSLEGNRNLISPGKVPYFLTVKRTYGDGAYDQMVCYRANYHHGSTAIIPPRRNGQYHAGAPDYFLERNKSLLEIKGLGEDENARKLWKKLRGYHRRSLAETGMYRFKVLFGRDLKCRTFQGQQSEALC